MLNLIAGKINYQTLLCTSESQHSLETACVCVCVFSVKLLSTFISKSCTGAAAHDTLARQCQTPGAPASRDCSGVLVVASLERRDCSRVLTVCIQATSLEARVEGAQGVLWWVTVGCYEPTVQVLLYSYTDRHHTATNYSVTACQ